MTLWSMTSAPDWNAWARRAERALAFGDDRESWKALFAPGAVFSDPHTTTPTGALGDISSQTAAIFPDWTQEITTIRGGKDWAVFEWIGRATYTPNDGGPGAAGAGAPIEMHGITIIEVDAEGRVTTWRDYLDRKEPEDQIRRHARKS